MNHRSIVTRILCVNGNCQKKTIVNTGKDNSKKKCKAVYNNLTNRLKHKSIKHRLSPSIFMPSISLISKSKKHRKPLTAAQKRIKKRVETKKKNQQMSKIRKQIKTLKKTLTKLKTKK
jgi:hypothetical protein